MECLDSAQYRTETGFSFELYVQSLLDQYGISYIGNPKEFGNWCKRTLKGCDIISCGFKIEAKCINKKIYYSWYLRDWKPKTAHIFVVSDLSNLPYDVRRDISKDRKMIVSPHGLVLFLSKIIHREKMIKKLSKDLGIELDANEAMQVIYGLVRLKPQLTSVQSAEYEDFDIFGFIKDGDSAKDKVGWNQYVGA